MSWTGAALEVESGLGPVFAWLEERARGCDSHGLWPGDCHGSAVEVTWDCGAEPVDAEDGGVVAGGSEYAGRAGEERVMVVLMIWGGAAWEGFGERNKACRCMSGKVTYRPWALYGQSQHAAQLEKFC